MQAQVTILNSEGKSVYNGPAELSNVNAKGATKEAVASVPDVGFVRVKLIDGRWVGVM